MQQIMQDDEGNLFEVDAAGNVVRQVGSSAPSYVPPSGARQAKEQRDRAREDARDARAAASAERAAEAASRQADAAERAAGSQDYNNTLKLRGDYDALPIVKEYRVSVGQLAQALKTAPDATGDNALIYAYAKAMDPGSVVRESEMGMAASGASVFDSVAANMKKQFGIDGGGQLSPDVRDRLRREIRGKVVEMNKLYSAQRKRFADDARAFGLDPARIIGNHDGDVYVQQFRDYDAKRREGRALPMLDSLINSGASTATIKETMKRQNYDVSMSQIDAARKWKAENPGANYSGARVADDGDYASSALGQGMSGVNEGIASVVGLPVDLAAGAINLGTGGINAIAGTNIPRIENPLLGSDWLKSTVLKPTIYEENGDGSNGVIRRIGQSVGASIIPAARAGNLALAGGQLAIGAGGGAGGAVAQQAFPDNPVAEMVGEAVGGGLSAAGIVKSARSAADQAVREAVPTIPQLKERASELYRAAESRGVVATPTMTEELSENFKAALAAEGRISPTGRISEVYPKAKEAAQLIADYAGKAMTPTEMQTVRQVAADGLTSIDSSERRLGSILTDVFDEWAAPLAPELPQARNVASRYLTAERLTRARELAGARAGQFSGSGFENALRTEYRGLDRDEIKDRLNFSPALTDAVQKVSRGTPASNFFRGLGRLAPTGPVSGMGSVLPGLGVASVADPMTGGAVGLSLAGAGIGGRAVATHMGINAADEAELIARNGGALPYAKGVDPKIAQILRDAVMAQAGKYSTEQ